MEKIFAPIKERVTKLPSILDIPIGNFYKRIGSSSANFRGKSLESEVSSQVIEKISTEFPEVSLEWLITGKGEMLKKESPGMSSNREIQGLNEEINKYLREISELKDKIISLQEERFKNERNTHAGTGHQ